MDCDAVSCSAAFGGFAHPRGLGASLPPDERDGVSATAFFAGASTRS